MSALADEIRAAVREALREELPRVLAELRGGGDEHQPPDMLDVAAAARRLGLGTSTVRRLAARCELPSHKLGGRLVFAPADLAAYAQARRRSPEKVRALVRTAGGGDHA